MEIIFMSGYSERVVTDRRELAGPYLQKPFSPEALVTKVRSVLGSPRTTGTVLVVDDEGGTPNFLRKVLSGVSYSVIEAGSGSEAIQRLEASEVDLVVLDLASDQEGIGTIKTLRGLRPQLKIIVISRQFAGQPDMAKHLGADASIAKPILPDQLLDAVARVMVG
jgi:CheY-like chemotaxis protein